MAKGSPCSKVVKQLGAQPDGILELIAIYGEGVKLINKKIKCPDITKALGIVGENAKVMRAILCELAIRIRTGTLLDKGMKFQEIAQEIGITDNEDKQVLENHIVFTKGKYLINGGATNSDIDERLGTTDESFGLKEKLRYSRDTQKYIEERMNDADMKNGTEGTKEEKLIAFIKEAKDSAGIVENFEWIGKLSRDKEQHYSRDSDYIHSLAFCIFDRKARTLFDEGKSFYEVLEETTKIAKMIGITVGDCATMGERYVLEFWALKSQAPAKLISDGKSFKEVVEKLGISYESTREALQCAFVRTGLIKHLKEGYPFSDFLLSIEMSFSSFLDDTKWKATHPFLSVEWKS